MKERNLTCIVCPRGCQMKIIFGEDGSIASVSGNFCKRGVTYAQDKPLVVAAIGEMTDRGLYPEGLWN